MRRYIFSLLKYEEIIKPRRKRIVFSGVDFPFPLFSTKNISQEIVDLYPVTKSYKHNILQNM